MKIRKFILVSDKFAAFAIGKDVLTLSQLDAMFNLPKHVIGSTIQLILGQGVSAIDMQNIVSRIETTRELKESWLGDNLASTTEWADCQLSHKSKPCNVLISKPAQISADSYTMDILIDENCELMGDHQTGQHIQGMILIEATRQAFLAVTEMFLLDDSNQKSYFVINKMETNFLGFVFPVHAIIKYRIIEKVTKHDRHRFEVAMDVMQADKVCATCQVNFTVYPDAVIAEKEAELATDVAKFALENKATASTDQEPVHELA